MRQRVAQQALRGCRAIDDAVARDTCHLRRPRGGDRVLRQLDDVDAAGLRLAEDAGHILELAPGESGEVRRAVLALLGHIDVNVADARCGDRRQELARDDGSGKSRLRPDEAELAASVGQRLLCRRPAADGGVIGGHADVHLAGEAVGKQAGRREREPAARVEQYADGVGDGGQFNPVNRTGVGAGQHACIREVEGVAGAFGQRRGQRYAHGEVGGQSLGVERGAAVVCERCDVEAVVQLEGRRGQVFQRGEADICRGRQPASRWVEIGVDDVAGNVELRARRRGIRSHPAGKRKRAEGDDRGGESEEAAGGSDSGSERHAFVNPQDAFTLNCNRKAACVILAIGCARLKSVSC